MFPLACFVQNVDGDIDLAWTLKYLNRHGGNINGDVMGFWAIIATWLPKQQPNVTILLAMKL